MKINLNYVSAEEVENWNISLESLGEAKWELDQAVAMEDEENCKEMFRRYSAEFGLETYGQYIPNYSIEQLIKKIDAREDLILSNVDVSNEGVFDRLARWFNWNKENMEKLKKKGDDVIANLNLLNDLVKGIKPTKGGNTSKVAVWLQLGNGKLDFNKINSYYKENTPFAMVTLVDQIKQIVGDPANDEKFTNLLSSMDKIIDWTNRMKASLKLGPTVKAVNELLLNAVNKEAFVTGTVVFFPVFWQHDRAEFLAGYYSSKDGFWNKLSIGTLNMFVFFSKWVASITSVTEKFVNPILTKEVKIPSAGDVNIYHKNLVAMGKNWPKYFEEINKNYSQLWNRMKEDQSKEMNQIFRACTKAAKEEVNGKLLSYMHTIRSVQEYIESLV